MLSNTYSGAPLIQLLRIAKGKGLITSWSLETRYLMLTGSVAQFSVPVVEAGVVLQRMIHEAEHELPNEVIG